jgi:hypothetical protein
MYDQTYDGGAGLAAFGMMFWLIIIAAYLYVAWTQYKIAQKCGEHESAWWSFIPILNTFLLCKTAGKDWWWVLLCLVPLVNIVAFAMLWIETAKNCGSSPFWGFCVLLPFINIIALGVMAFGSGSAPSSQPPRQFDRPRQPTGVA